MFKRLLFTAESGADAEIKSGIASDTESVADNSAHESANLTFNFAEQTISAQPGDTVAAALLLHGTVTFGEREGVSKSPYCMMGACYECLVEIDGHTVQACMVEATQDLLVMPLDRSQNRNQGTSPHTDAQTASVQSTQQ